MSCIGSIRYNIGLKCKYAKILLTTKVIQHSKSMQNDAQKCNFKQKHWCWVFLRHCLAWFRMLGYFYSPAVEPLADARRTLGFHGTPVENHCRTIYIQALRLDDNCLWLYCHRSELWCSCLAWQDGHSAYATQSTVMSISSLSVLLATTYLELALAKSAARQ